MKVTTSPTTHRAVPYKRQSMDGEPKRQCQPVSAGESLIDELRQIHRQLCQLPSDEDLKTVVDHMQDVKISLCGLARCADFKEASVCRAILSNIKILASATINARCKVTEARVACAEMVRSQKVVVFDNKDKDTGSVGFGEQTSSPQHDPYRLWFLNHLSYPYPSQKDCKLLLEQVPSETIGQLRTWFTNTRRRSGWSDLYKKYTDGSALKMSKLLDAINSPLEQTSSLLFAVETIEEARADLEAVKEYFGRSEERKKVSSWINDSIEKTKHLPTTVIRTPQSSPASSEKSSPPSSPTPSPTRKRGRKNAKPSLYDKPNIPVIQTDDIPVIAPQMTLLDPMW